MCIRALIEYIECLVLVFAAMVGSPCELVMWMHGQPNCKRLFQFWWLDLDWYQDQDVRAIVVSGEHGLLLPAVLIFLIPTFLTENVEQQLDQSYFTPSNFARVYLMVENE